MSKPRTVRNFWLEAEADGRNGVTIGPRAADGRMNATLSIRDAGRVASAVDIEALVGRFAFDDGTLRLFVTLPADAQEVEGARAGMSRAYPEGTRVFMIERHRTRERRTAEPIAEVRDAYDALALAVRRADNSARVDRITSDDVEALRAALAAVEEGVRA